MTDKLSIATVLHEARTDAEVTTGRCYCATCVPAARCPRCAELEARLVAIDKALESGELGKVAELAKIRRRRRRR